MIIRCDSAAIVPKTSELLPEPETPVKTVRRRFGISTLTSLRLLTRAPVHPDQVMAVGRVGRLLVGLRTYRRSLAGAALLRSTGNHDEPQDGRHRSGCP